MKNSLMLSSTDFDLAFNGFVMGVNQMDINLLFKAGNYNNFMGYVNEELDATGKKDVVETDEAKKS